MTEFWGLVLAAGMGKRLRENEADTFPKVLRRVAGRPMIAYVLGALRGAGITDICVVVGAGAELIREEIGDSFARTVSGLNSRNTVAIHYAHQPMPKGSGDAAAAANGVMEGKSEHVVVMCGDSPLFTSVSVEALKTEHIKTGAVVTLATANLDDPTGYGRIVRREGRIIAVVEEKCATDEEKAIKEINGGLYVFRSDWLWANVGRIQPNETGEFYLTDLVRFAIEDEEAVAAVEVPAEQTLGVNTPEQLAIADWELNRRED